MVSFFYVTNRLIVENNFEYDFGSQAKDYHCMKLCKYNCSLIIMPYDPSKIIKIAVYQNSCVSRVTRIMTAI